MSIALFYTVLPGDSYFSITQGIDLSAGVNYQTLEAANPSIAASRLMPGQVLNIPSAHNASEIVLHYTVRPGDSYALIAQQLALCANLTVAELEAANPGTAPTALQPGQALQVPCTQDSPAPVPTPMPTPVAAPINTELPDESVLGYWCWSWDAGSAPAGANLGIAFSGWVSPAEALSNSLAVVNQLQGRKFICLGGGNSSGAWSNDAVNAVTQAIETNRFAGYQGIAYDIEEGSAGLEAQFAISFAAAKAKGMTVLVTVSHSCPYGIADAVSLMNSFFANRDIDLLSPQLYTTGQETSNDYTALNVPWSAYAQAQAAIVPSIVRANLYPSAQSYFADQGVTLGGFVQWAQN